MRLGRETYNSLLGHVPQLEARAALISLTVSVVLLIIKFSAYWLTHSAAVLSDALESIANVVAAGFALYSVGLAHAPADPEHPYGHGKIEFISAAFESGLILLAGLFIAGHAIADLFRGPTVQRVDVGLVLLVVATVVNAGVGVYLILIGRRNTSYTLQASGRHLLADALTTVVVLGALIIIKLTGFLWTDPIMALLIAVYLMYLSSGLLRRSLGQLMDEQDIADDLLIRGILDSHLAPDGKPPQICSYHKLRHRHSGRYHWIDMHLMIPPSHDITSAHNLASAIEYEVEQAIGPGNATAHVEPCGDVKHGHVKTRMSKPE